MFSVFRHSLRLTGVRHARVTTHVWTNQLRLYHRTLPFLCRASSGSTTWTLNSRVTDVLLRGARPPEEVPLSECLERVRHRGTDIDVDARMDIVIQRPEQFIPDADLREMVLSLPECQTYALVYRAVPLLEGNGITNFQQWYGADENTDAKRAVRNALANGWLWNTVCGLLNIAFNAAKDAETRKRVVMPESEAAVFVPGAFESVLNARWSHVLSGEAGMPLGMRVVDGLPENVWSYDEVNYNPSPLEVDKQAPRNGKLEIMVLSSEEGWPYTQFKNETENIDSNTASGKEGLLNEEGSNAVYIRREVVRVWYIVEEKMCAWYIERKLVEPRTCIVIGTPGIGKSFACGSFLLYQLLHYEGGLLDVVAYFVRDSAYVIHNARPGVPAPRPLGAGDGDGAPPPVLKHGPRSQTDAQGQRHASGLSARTERETRSASVARARVLSAGRPPAGCARVCLFGPERW
ncbi:putative retrotransposon hot spot protein 4 (RHS4) [Trypanosoma vivax]|nr:putative retrotransposon hot spot protein 4 (RHS4) [Trypanosoma vivax]